MLGKRPREDNWSTKDPMDDDFDWPSFINWAFDLITEHDIVDAMKDFDFKAEYQLWHEKQRTEQIPEQ